jgi:hypothetical protein
MVLSRSDEADWLSYRAAIIVAEKECCSNPQGLPGTAVRGPACTVVWELGGAIPPATRLSGSFMQSNIYLRELVVLLPCRANYDSRLVADNPKHEFAATVNCQIFKPP